MQQDNLTAIGTLRRPGISCSCSSRQEDDGIRMGRESLLRDSVPRLLSHALGSLRHGSRKQGQTQSLPRLVDMRLLIPSTSSHLTSSILCHCRLYQRHEIEG